MKVKPYFVARHKPSGRFFKWEEWCEDGWGGYILGPNQIELSSSSNEIAFFDKPEIREYATYSKDYSTYRFDDVTIPSNEIEFLKVTLSLEPVN